MRKLSIVVLGLSALWSAVPVVAHHAFSAEFDFAQPITLRGTLTKMAWTQPHGWIYVDVKSPDGKIEQWAIETGGPTGLLRRGLRKTDFPVGVEVVVQGYRAKNGSNTANGRTVMFPDGRNYFMGSSGTGAPTDGAEGRQPQEPPRQ